jgi:hypothetical protein
MTMKTVSVSATGQYRPKPTRHQRDAASSSGAGRMATELPIKLHERASRGDHEAPIGLDLETKAVQEFDENKRDLRSEHRAPIGLDLETKGEKDLDRQ